MTRKELIEQHIKTHTVNEEKDKQTVAFLECNLNKKGRIRTDFSDNDKWPNHDGTFEYIENTNYFIKGSIKNEYDKKNLY